MNNNEKIKDYAERLRKFYYSRVLLCEYYQQFDNKNFSQYVKENCHSLELLEMTPFDYDPFTNLFNESYILAFCLIDSLSYLEQKLTNQPEGKNGERFVSFVINIFDGEEKYSYLQNVSIPFFYQAIPEQFNNLQKTISKDKKDINKEIQQHLPTIKSKFIEEIEKKYLQYRNVSDLKSKHQSHSAKSDPNLEEILNIFSNIWYQETKQPFEKNKNLFDTIKNYIKHFRYCNLIYKKYRSSLVHNYQLDKDTESFNKNTDSIVIRWREDNSIKMDIGFNLLTDTIKRGADKIYNLILEKDLRDLEQILNINF